MLLAWQEEGHLQAVRGETTVLLLLLLLHAGSGSDAEERRMRVEVILWQQGASSSWGALARGSSREWPWEQQSHCPRKLVWEVTLRTFLLSVPIRLVLVAVESLTWQLTWFLTRLPMLLLTWQL